MPVEFPQYAEIVNRLTIIEERSAHNEKRLSDIEIMFRQWQTNIESFWRDKWPGLEMKLAALEVRIGSLAALEDTIEELRAEVHRLNRDNMKMYLLIAGISATGGASVKELITSLLGMGGI